MSSLSSILFDQPFENFLITAKLLKTRPKFIRVFIMINFNQHISPAMRAKYN